MDEETTGGSDDLQNLTAITDPTPPVNADPPVVSSDAQKAAAHVSQRADGFASKPRVVDAPIGQYNPDGSFIPENHKPLSSEDLDAHDGEIPESGEHVVHGENIKISDTGQVERDIGGQITTNHYTDIDPIASDSKASSPVVIRTTALMRPAPDASNAVTPVPDAPVPDAAPPVAAPPAAAELPFSRSTLVKPSGAASVLIANQHQQVLHEAHEKRLEKGSSKSFDADAVLRDNIAAKYHVIHSFDMDFKKGDDQKDDEGEGGPSLHYPMVDVSLAESGSRVETLVDHHEKASVKHMQTTDDFIKKIEEMKSAGTSIVSTPALPVINGTFSGDVRGNPRFQKIEENRQKMDEGDLSATPIFATWMFTKKLSRVVEGNAEISVSVKGTGDICAYDSGGNITTEDVQYGLVPQIDENGNTTGLWHRRFANSRPQDLAFMSADEREKLRGATIEDLRPAFVSPRKELLEQIVKRIVEEYNSLNANIEKENPEKAVEKILAIYQAMGFKTQTVSCAPENLQETREAIAAKYPDAVITKDGSDVDPSIEFKIMTSPVLIEIERLKKEASNLSASDPNAAQDLIEKAKKIAAVFDTRLADSVDRFCIGLQSLAMYSRSSMQDSLNRSRMMTSKEAKRSIVNDLRDKYVRTPARSQITSQLIKQGVSLPDYTSSMELLISTLNNKREKGEFKYNVVTNPEGDATHLERVFLLPDFKDKEIEFREPVIVPIGQDVNGKDNMQPVLFNGDFQKGNEFRKYCGSSRYAPRTSSGLTIIDAWAEIVKDFASNLIDADLAGESLDTRMSMQVNDPKDLDDRPSVDYGIEGAEKQGGELVNPVDDLMTDEIRKLRAEYRSTLSWNEKAEILNKIRLAKEKLQATVPSLSAEHAYDVGRPTSPASALLSDIREIYGDGASKEEIQRLVTKHLGPTFTIRDTKGKGINIFESEKNKVSGVIEKTEETLRPSLMHLIFGDKFRTPAQKNLFWAATVPMPTGVGIDDQVTPFTAPGRASDGSYLYSSGTGPWASRGASGGSVSTVYSPMTQLAVLADEQINKKVTDELGVLQSVLLAAAQQAQNKASMGTGLLSRAPDAPLLAQGPVSGDQLRIPLSTVNLDFVPPDIKKLLRIGAEWTPNEDEARLVSATMGILDSGKLPSLIGHMGSSSSPIYNPASRKDYLAEALKNNAQAQKAINEIDEITTMLPPLGQPLPALRANARGYHKKLDDWINEKDSSSGMMVVSSLARRVFQDSGLRLIKLAPSEEKYGKAEAVEIVSVDDEGNEVFNPLSIKEAVTKITAKIKEAKSGLQEKILTNDELQAEKAKNLATYDPLAGSGKADEPWRPIFRQAVEDFALKTMKDVAGKINAGTASKQEIDGAKDWCAKIIAGSEMGLSGPPSQITSFPGKTNGEQVVAQNQWNERAKEIKLEFSKISDQDFADELQRKLINPLESIINETAIEALISGKPYASSGGDPSYVLARRISKEIMTVRQAMQSLLTFSKTNPQVIADLKKESDNAETFDQIIEAESKKYFDTAKELHDAAHEQGVHVIDSSDPDFFEGLRGYCPAVHVSGSTPSDSLMQIIDDRQDHHDSRANPKLGVTEDTHWFQDALKKYVNEQVSSKLQSTSVSKENYMQTSIKSMILDETAAGNIEEIISKLCSIAEKDELMEIIANISLSAPEERKTQAEEIARVIAERITNYCQENNITIASPSATDRENIGRGMQSPTRFASNIYPRAIEPRFQEALPSLFIAGNTELLTRNTDDCPIEKAIGILAPQLSEIGKVPRRHLEAQFESFLDVAMDEKGMNLIFRIPWTSLKKGTESRVTNMETIFCSLAARRKKSGSGNSSDSQIIIITDGEIPQVGEEGTLFKQIIALGGCIITPKSPGVTENLSKDSEIPAFPTQMGRIFSQLSSSIMLMDSIPSEQYLEANPLIRKGIHAKAKKREGQLWLARSGVAIDWIAKKAQDAGKSVFAWNHGDASDIFKINGEGHLLGNLEKIELGSAIPTDKENLREICDEAQESAKKHMITLDKKEAAIQGATPERRRLLEMLQKIGEPVENKEIQQEKAKIAELKYSMSRKMAKSSTYKIYKRVDDALDYVDPLIETLENTTVTTYGNMSSESRIAVNKFADKLRTFEINFEYNPETLVSKIIEQIKQIKMELATNLTNLMADSEVRDILSIEGKIKQGSDRIRDIYEKDGASIIFADESESDEFYERALEAFYAKEKEEANLRAKIIDQMRDNGIPLLVHAPEANVDQYLLLAEARRQHVPATIVPGSVVYSELNLANKHDESGNIIQINQIEDDPDMSPLSIDFILPIERSIVMQIYGKGYSFRSAKAAYYALLIPSLAEYLSTTNAFDLTLRTQKIERLLNSQKTIDPSEVDPEFNKSVSNIFLATSDIPATITNISGSPFVFSIDADVGTNIRYTITLDKTMHKWIENIENNAALRISVGSQTETFALKEKDPQQGTIVIERKFEYGKPFFEGVNQQIENIQVISTSSIYKEMLDSFKKATVHDKLEAMYEANNQKFQDGIMKGWLTSLGSNPNYPSATRLKIHNGRDFTGTQPDEILWGIPNRSMKSNNSGIQVGRGYDGLGEILTFLKYQNYSGVGSFKSTDIWKKFTDPETGASLSFDPTKQEIPMLNFAISCHDKRALPLFGIHPDEIVDANNPVVSHEIIPSQNVRAGIIMDPAQKTVKNEDLDKVIQEIKRTLNIDIQETSVTKSEGIPKRDGDNSGNKDYPVIWPAKKSFEKDSLPSYPTSQLMAASHVVIVFYDGDRKAIADSMRKARLMGKPMIVVRKNNNSFDYEVIFPYSNTAMVSVVSPYNAHLHRSVSDPFETTQNKFPNLFSRENYEFVRNLRRAAFIASFDARNERVSDSLTRSLASGQRVYAVHDDELFPQNWNGNQQGMINAHWDPVRSGLMALLLGMKRKRRRGFYVEDGSSLSNMDYYSPVNIREQNFAETERAVKEAKFQRAFETMNIFGNPDIIEMLTSAGKQWLENLSQQNNGDSTKAFYGKESDTNTSLLMAYIKTIDVKRTAREGDMLPSQEKELQEIEEELSNIKSLELLTQIQNNRDSLASQIRYSLENDNLVIDPFGSLDETGSRIGLTPIAKYVIDHLNERNKTTILSNSVMRHMSEKFRNQLIDWMRSQSGRNLAYLLRDIKNNSAMKIAILEDLSSSTITSDHNARKEALLSRKQDLEEEAGNRMKQVNVDALKEVFDELLDEQRGMGRTTMLGSPVIFRTPVISMMAFPTFPDLFAVIQTTTDRQAEKARTNVDVPKTEAVVKIYKKGEDGKLHLVHRQSIKLADRVNIDIRHFTTEDGTSDKGFIEYRKQLHKYAERVAYNWLAEYHAMQIHDIASGIDLGAKFSDGKMQLAPNTRPFDLLRKTGVLNVHRSDAIHDVEGFPYGTSWGDTKAIKLTTDDFFYRRRNVNFSNVYSVDERDSRIDGNFNLGAHRSGFVETDNRDIIHQLSAVPLNGRFSGLASQNAFWRRFQENLLSLVGNNADMSKLRLLRINATGYDSTYRQDVGDIAWLKPSNFNMSDSTDIKSDINMMSIYYGADLIIPDAKKTEVTSQGRPVYTSAAPRTEPGLLKVRTTEGEKLVTRYADYFSRINSIIGTGKANSQELIQAEIERIVSRLVNSVILWQKNQDWNPTAKITIDLLLKKSKEFIFNGKSTDDKEAVELFDQLNEVIRNPEKMKNLESLLRSNEQAENIPADVKSLKDKLTKIGMHDILSNSFAVLRGIKTIIGGPMTSYVLPYSQQLVMLRDELIWGGRRLLPNGKDARGVSSLMSWFYDENTTTIGPEKPSSPTKNQLWWDTSSSKLTMYKFDGSDWKEQDDSSRPYVDSNGFSYIIPSLFSAINNTVGGGNSTADFVTTSIRNIRADVTSRFVNLSPQIPREMIDASNPLFKKVFARNDGSETPMVQQLPFINLAIRFMRSINVDVGATSQKQTLLHTLASLCMPKIKISEMSRIAPTDKSLKLGTGVFLTPGLIYAARIWPIESMKMALTGSEMTFPLDPSCVSTVVSLDSGVNTIMLCLTMGKIGGVQFSDVFDTEVRNETIVNENGTTTIVQDEPVKVVSHQFIIGVPISNSRLMTDHLDEPAQKRYFKQIAISVGVLANIKHQSGETRKTMIDGRYHSQVNTIKFASDEEPIVDFYEKFKDHELVKRLVMTSVDDNNVPYNINENINTRQKRAMLWAKIYSLLLAKKKAEVELPSNGYVRSAELNLLNEDALSLRLFPEVDALETDGEISASEEWKRMCLRIKQLMQLDLLGARISTSAQRAETAPEIIQSTLEQQEEMKKLDAIMNYDENKEPKNPDSPAILAEQRRIFSLYKKLKEEEENLDKSKTSLEGSKKLLEKKLEAIKAKTTPDSQELIDVITKVLSGAYVSLIPSGISELTNYYDERKAYTSKLLEKERRMDLLMSDFLVKYASEYFNPETIMTRESKTIQQLIDEVSTKLNDYYDDSSVSIIIKNLSKENILSYRKVIAENGVYGKPADLQGLDLGTPAYLEKMEELRKDPNSVWVLPLIKATQMGLVDKTLKDIDEKTLDSSHPIFIYAALAEALTACSGSIKDSPARAVAIAPPPAGVDDIIASAGDYPWPTSFFALRVNPKIIKDSFPDFDGIVTLYKLFIMETKAYLSHYQNTKTKNLRYDDNMERKIRNQTGNVAITVPFNVSHDILRSLFVLHETGSDGKKIQVKQNSNNPTFQQNAFLKWLCKLKDKNGNSVVDFSSNNSGIFAQQINRIDKLSHAQYKDLLEYVIKQVIAFQRDPSKNESQIMKSSNNKKQYSLPYQTNMPENNQNPWGRLPSLAKILYNKINI